MPVRLFLLIVVAIAEAIPLAMLAALLAPSSLPSDADSLTPALVVAVALGFALARWLRRRRTSTRATRGLLVLGGLAAALVLSLGPLLPRIGNVVTQHMDALIAATMALLFAWYHGTVLAGEGLSFDAVYALFRRALILLFIGLVLSALRGGDVASGLAANSWGRIVLFFLCGLCALATARVEEERRRGGIGARAATWRGEWIMTLVGVIGAVLLIGLGLAAAFSPLALTATWGLLGTLREALVRLLTPLVLLLSALLDPLTRAIRWLLGGHKHSRPISSARPGRIPSLAPIDTTPVQLARDIVGVVALIAVFAMLWYITFIWRKGMRVARLERSDDVAEERVSLWSWHGLAGAVMAALRRLYAHVIGRRAAVGHGPPARVRSASDEQIAPSSVRAVYRRMLERTARLGLPRRCDETPQEYLGRLRRLPIPAERDAALLTATYTHVRYGTEPETVDQREQAARAWTRLERALNNRRKGIE